MRDVRMEGLTVWAIALGGASAVFHAEQSRLGNASHRSLLLEPGNISSRRRPTG